MTKNYSNKNIPKARKAVEELMPYSAPLEGRRNLLRLDFNENTLGPSPKVIKAIKNISNNHISTYPEYSGLRNHLIHNLKSQYQLINIDHSEIGIFNGVDAAINAIFHAYGDKNDTLLTTTPTFGYYAPCAKMRGMNIVEIPYTGISFNYPVLKIKEIITHLNPRILIICNPNNPTGTTLQPDEIFEISNSASETLIVIDELYEAFTNTSIIPHKNFKHNPNLIVLRSLSKTAGLAGLRIGFAIGNSYLIDRISRVTGPYDINSFAVTAAFAALDDQAYIDRYIREVIKAKKWIEKKLINNHTRYHIAGGNYLLIWPKSPASTVERYLRDNGILIRNMGGKQLINGSIRVSVGSTSQMKRFWQVFEVANNL